MGSSTTLVTRRDAGAVWIAVGMAVALGDTDLPHRQTHMQALRRPLCPSAAVAPRWPIVLLVCAGVLVGRGAHRFAAHELAMALSSCSVESGLRRAQSPSRVNVYPECGWICI